MCNNNNTLVIYWYLPLVIQTVVIRFSLTSFMGEITRIMEAFHQRKNNKLQNQLWLQLK